MTTIESFVKKYYELLDLDAPLERLQAFFDEDGFEIIEGNMQINSFEAYASWYKNIAKSFYKKTHTILSMKVEKIKNNYQVFMHMSFEGAKENRENIRIHADIHWHIIEKNNHFKLKKYEVHIKE